MPLALAQVDLLTNVGSILAASPPILFFFLGAIARLAKSNLHVPKPVTKLLSLYLLWAIGFKGGVELAVHGVSKDAAIAMIAGMLLASAMPLVVFYVTRTLTSVANAAPLAATYGSISAVTFMAACTVLESKGIDYGGHMVAVMALMESPAIVVGVLLWRKHGAAEAAPAPLPTQPARKHSWASLLHEAFLNGPVLLLLGSLAIGMITGQAGYAKFKPLCTDLFSGVLVFFLLDLGILAARRLRDLRKAPKRLILLGILFPLLGAVSAASLAKLGGLGFGDTFLLIVLAASASYIAVPAAIRLVIPQATPGLYIPMALAVTFPFNIGIGIPLYLAITAFLQPK
jgi:hypothetical protein